MEFNSPVQGDSKDRDNNVNNLNQVEGQENGRRKL